MGFARSDECHELPVPKQDRPQTRAFGDRGLARATRHCEREQAAVEYRFFDLGNHATMVV